MRFRFLLEGTFPSLIQYSPTNSIHQPSFSLQPPIIHDMNSVTVIDISPVEQCFYFSLLSRVIKRSVRSPSSPYYTSVKGLYEGHFGQVLTC